VWERTHDVKAVVDQIVEETYQGLSVPQHLGATARAS
jgi:hypothetical protein